MKASEVQPGYLLRTLPWRLIRLNNWMEAEVTKMEAKRLIAMPTKQVDPNGKPLELFYATFEDVDKMVADGILEIVRVVESDSAAR